MKQITLQPTVTKKATFTGGNYDFWKNPRELIATLVITSAERDDADETYDIYITTGDGQSTWDIIHFPQVAAEISASTIYTAGVNTRLLPETMTTAVPGVLAINTATMKTDTAGAGNGVGTLGSGLVRHGPIGNRVGHKLVVAGTVTTGISYSITVSMREPT